MAVETSVKIATIYSTFLPSRNSRSIDNDSGITIFPSVANDSLHCILRRVRYSEKIQNLQESSHNSSLGLPTSQDLSSFDKVELFSERDETKFIAASADLNAYIDFLRIRSF